MRSSKIDYIRITGIYELDSDTDSADVTFNIEHSANQDFSKLKTGIITLRLSELIDVNGYQEKDIELIASQLVKQVLIRERDEDRLINILHFDGLPLEDWLLSNTPIQKH
ncbi:MAG: hypothetical protein AAF462_04820 [Thermodesulfobacteriota bacterium]